MHNWNRSHNLLPGTLSLLSPSCAFTTAPPHPRICSGIVVNLTELGISSRSQGLSDRNRSQTHLPQLGVCKSGRLLCPCLSFYLLMTQIQPLQTLSDPNAYMEKVNLKWNVLPRELFKRKFPPPSYVFWAGQKFKLGLFLEAAGAFQFKIACLCWEAYMPGIKFYMH